MRTYILAIATATLFAIPTAAFSESVQVETGDVQDRAKLRPPLLLIYNRYEGLYNHCENGR